MCQEEAEKLSNGSEHCQVRKVACLLAQALSPRKSKKDVNTLKTHSRFIRNLSPYVHMQIVVQG